MNIKLVKASIEYKEKLTEMLDEWKTDIEVNHTNHSPSVIFRNDHHDFENYIEKLDRKEEIDGMATNSVFFCYDEDREIFVGAVDIRHYLNENFILTGGHIGDGIRPSERRKGYATAMIGLALEECKKLGINQVLITCAKDNIGSAKAIMNNGGVFESEIEEDGEIEQRYWIKLKEERIETDRLVLRRVMPYDYKEVSAWTMDDRVCKFLMSGPGKSPEDALVFLRRNDPSSKERYIMIAHSKDDGHAVGILGISHIPEEDVWEISYTTLYDDWGKGYTTEAAKAFIDYVKNERDAHHFIGIFAEENVGSGKVLEKLGMTYKEDTSYTKRDGSATFKAKVYEMEV